ncbi:hypothetical protein L4V69_20430 [Pseudomonas aeruginosa]|uniref:Uncharacterized protein n=1 Tax=Pseudomonas aeruginosa TaxID=287 RepID=A0AAQ3LEH0_PSEAI|nr:hypothetical protein L4V69_20430 [Pseudomonas aeruginosa]
MLSVSRRLLDGSAKRITGRAVDHGWLQVDLASQELAEARKPLVFVMQDV